MSSFFYLVKFLSSFSELIHRVARSGSFQSCRIPSGPTRVCLYIHVYSFCSSRDSYHRKKTCRSMLSISVFWHVAETKETVETLFLCISFWVQPIFKFTVEFHRLQNPSEFSSIWQLFIWEIRLTPRSRGKFLKHPHTLPLSSNLLRGCVLQMFHCEWLPLSVSTEAACQSPKGHHFTLSESSAS